MSQKLKLNRNLNEKPTLPRASGFVSECLQKIEATNSWSILELPVGIGRNTELLSKTGAEVTAADLDERVFSFTKKELGNVAYVRLDAQKALPFNRHSFDFIVVVHMFYHSLLGILDPLLKPGGHLLLETFGAQGDNWRELPRESEIEDFLASRGYKIVLIRKRDVKATGRVTIKVLAQKIDLAVLQPVAA